jgi:hypothetical protein
MWHWYSKLYVKPYNTLTSMKCKRYVSSSFVQVYIVYNSVIVLDLQFKSICEKFATVLEKILIII